MSQQHSARSRSAHLLRALARRIEPSRNAPELEPLPFDGYTEARAAVKYVDLLSDAQLRELNSLLPWKAYVVDSRGRRFGDRFGGGKKEDPWNIDDARVRLLDETFGIADKHVLEVGCLEGLYTIALCQRAQSVTAVDIQVDYVVKTIVRNAFFGLHPDVFVCDLETWDDDDALRADVVFHVGVLYHLADPVRHVHRLGRLTRCGILLDTQVAAPHEATETMDVDGKTYAYKRYDEPPGYASQDHSKWLRLDDLLELLDEAGFDRIQHVETRDERNGPRVQILAHKKPG